MNKEQYDGLLDDAHRGLHEAFTALDVAHGALEKMANFHARNSGGRDAQGVYPGANLHGKLVEKVEEAQKLLREVHGSYFLERDKDQR